MLGFTSRFSEAAPLNAVNTAPTVLIAAPTSVSREIRDALGSGVAVMAAQTFHEATTQLERGHVDLIIICYVFDEVRPYRLLNHIKTTFGVRMPMVLVRAVPVPLQGKEEEVRRSYEGLGVEAFFNVSDDAARIGRAAALHRLSDWVVSRLHA
jgi:PleD family two-component response regulator